MARPPSFLHPVRRVRDITGTSQWEFARLIGISSDTLKSIENAQIPLSDDIALRIFSETGAEPRSLRTLIKGQRGFSKKKISEQPILDIAGRIYDHVSLRQFGRSITSREVGTVPDEELTRAETFATMWAIGNAKHAVDILLRAADQKGCLASLITRLYAWIDQTCDDTNLRAAATEVAASGGSAEDIMAQQGIDSVPDQPPRQVDYCMRGLWSSEWPQSLVRANIETIASAKRSQWNQEFEFAAEKSTAGATLDEATVLRALREHRAKIQDSEKLSKQKVGTRSVFTRPILPREIRFAAAKFGFLRLED